MLFANDNWFDGRAITILQPLDTFVDNDFGSAGSGCHENRFNTFEPLGIHVCGTVNQIRIDAFVFGQLTKPLAVGAVLATEYETDVSTA